MHADFVEWNAIAEIDLKGSTFESKLNECIKKKYNVYFRICFVYVVFFPIDKNPDVFEKYLAFASLTFFSAAWGFTISRP